MKNKKVDFSTYKANDFHAFIMLIIPFLIAGIGCYLSFSETLWLYITGQLLLSFFFLQTFILLHECGHLNFFKSKIFNVVFGNVFGFLTMIPYYSWQHMHNLHHRWTGWRDKDPTTEKTVEPSSSAALRLVANLCWWLFIPIFYLVYKLSNYWNLGKMKRFLNVKRFRKAALYVIIYFLTYSIIVYFFWDAILIYILPAFIISLVWKELVILTQHSHIEIPISEGKKVKPIQFKDQIQYSRSFYVNSLFAQYFLFNFNLHEVHHAFPGLPAYFLQKIDLQLPRKPLYSEWFLKAKSMKGEDYIFRTSKHTGKKF
jgi:fatty acid desaturase